ncbi:hypothetical protein L2E82_30215 [Cichorium intybus]|uniref:Uncharacterized protein n=1 Tax=Cichorium intybus TaxID=13427 RepID=A0ACB9D063_CICIN|nr:hypothetical protein L2E82_30215 [Cichorium intybus]
MDIMGFISSSVLRVQYGVPPGDTLSENELNLPYAHKWDRSLDNLSESKFLLQQWCLYIHGNFTFCPILLQPIVIFFIDEYADLQRIEPERKPANQIFFKRRLPTGTLKPAIHSSSSISATADSGESSSTTTYTSESASATSDAGNSLSATANPSNPPNCHKKRFFNMLYAQTTNSCSISEDSCKKNVSKSGLKLPTKGNAGVFIDD